MIVRFGLGVLAALWLATAATAQERVAPDSSAEIQLSFAPIVKRVAPAVVNVYATRTVQQQVSPFFSDPFFQQFFGDAFGGGMPDTRVQRSLGSGVIISPDGLIVTNFHVIEQADEVRIALSDKREFPADIVLKDERSDLAVLKLQGAADLPTIAYADSDTVEVGDLVLAIGDPFGVGQTVTSGIVSAFARVPGGPTEDQYFIQTDAAINPGNSGGALVDMQGRLIGINRMIVSPSGASSGIGFAIPSNLVRIVAAAAESGGIPRRPWLGADLQTMTADLASAFGVATPAGVVVASVDEAGPAYAGGLVAGDLIVKMDDAPVDDLGALNYRLATKQVGGSVKFEVVREGKRYVATVALITAPETVPREPREMGGDSPFTGLTVLNLSPAVAEELGWQGSLDGVIVSEVPNGTNGARAGFARGDVISEVNGEAVSSTSQLADISEAETRRWDMVVKRGGRAMRFSFRG